MTTLRVIASWLLLFFLMSGAGTIVAQTSPETEWPGSVPPIPILITGTVDETELVTLLGNTRPEANATNDQGRLADSFPLEHMILLLRRSRVQEQALTGLIDRLHDPTSPYFHRWLTAQQLGERYGLAQSDIHTVTRWLKSHGFSVNTVYPNQSVIDFSGTAGQVRQAFHTEIHRLKVGDADHIANMTDPQIPAALAPAIVGVVSLSDFMPQPMYDSPANLTTTNCSAPTTFTCYYVVPADLATIYNLNPLFEAGFSGRGQTIVLVEDSDVYSPANWTTFRNVLGLSGYTEGSFTQIHPAPPKGANNCTDPGANGADGEAILDAEWSSAAAPNAAILMITCADTNTTFGGFIALQNLLSTGSPPGIISISYGASETDNGAASNAFINSLYQEAVTAGVSVFVSAGDQAAAVSDRGAHYATHGINVNGWGSTVYNVSVGGTDFGDTYAGTNGTYWSATNGPTYGSALSYVPEIPWNNTCASVLISNYFGFSVPYGAAGDGSAQRGWGSRWNVQGICQTPLAIRLWQSYRWRA
jgi:subtilase family serine protease